MLMIQYLGTMHNSLLSVFASIDTSLLNFFVWEMRATYGHKGLSYPSFQWIIWPKRLLSALSGAYWQSNQIEH